MGVRWIGVLCLSLSPMLLSVGNASAEDLYAELRRDAQRRLNISGRQRMLSQRIAKAACLAVQLAQKEELLGELKKSRDLFMQSMKALRHGSPEMGLMPERDPEVLPLLNKAEKLATEYDKHIAALLSDFSGEAKQGELQAVYELSLPLLVALDDVVTQIEANHDDGQIVRAGLAKAINVSGRQRMLSQKMSKEVCLIAQDYNASLTRAHLTGTIALFKSSHQRLKQSIAAMGLNDKEGAPILAQLSLIEQHWENLAKIIDRVGGGEPPAQPDLDVIARESKTFLAELNEAVELYEKVDISAD